MITTIIIGLLLFIYLVNRISHLEQKVKELELGKSKVVPSVAPISQPLSATHVSQHVQTPTPVIVKVNPFQATPVVPPVAAKEIPKTLHKNTDEFAVGSKLLTGVGIFAVLLGVGFFLRYAFENNLITPVGRVALGVVFGIILAAVGHFLKNKFRQYGLSLVGGGLGVLFISFYSAYVFYGLIGASVAFGLLLLVAAIGVALSLMYNSIELITFSLIGAYIIPFLLPLSDSVHAFFAYLLILTLTVLLIARAKAWPLLTLASLLGTTLVYTKWLGFTYDDTLLVQTLSYGTIIFFIYFVTSVLNFMMRDRDYKGSDAILLYAVPALYFLLNYRLLHVKTEYALFSLSIALFYIIVSYGLRVVFKERTEIITLSNAMFFISSPFVAIATSFYFEGKIKIVMLAFESFVIVATGFTLRDTLNRAAGLILSGFVGLSLFIYGFSLPLNAVAIFNTRTLTFLLVTVAFYGIWLLYKTNSYYGKVVLSPEEQKNGNVVGVIGAFFIPIIWVWAEAWHFSTIPFIHIALFWTIYAGIVMLIAFHAHEKMFRYMSYVALAFIPMWLFAARISYAAPRAFFNMHVLVAIIYVAVLYVTYVLIKKYATILSHDEQHLLPTVILVASNAVMFLTGSIEIVHYFNAQVGMENVKRVVLSIFWLIYASGALTAGFVWRSVFARQLSILLFVLSIGKIFLYDTANLSDIYRFVSFISLGIILLIAGYSYYRFKDRITSFVQGKE